MRTSKIFVTTDAVVFKKIDGENHILFIKRKNDPDKGKWALPGGFVDENEDLPIAAARELEEETGLILNNMEQLGAFGKPGRDPRGHMVSVAYTGFAPDDAVAVGADDAEEAQWFMIKTLPEMAFDHADIVTLALQKHKL
ncbi:MAG: NUDIX hydrolase [Bacteroidota bacterium]